MKPVAFDFCTPESVDEAVHLLREYGGDARILAGGQSLIPLLNFRLAQPKVIIDINRLTALDGIEQRDGSLILRAITRESVLERSAAVALGWPLLPEAARHIGHTAIRNRGTIGGSAAHADPSGELPTVLTALDARFHARSATRGLRTIPVDDFFIGPLTSALDDDELLLEIELPPVPQRSGGAFVEYARRHGDFALAGAAVRLTLDEDEVCIEASIVLLGAGDRPLRCPAAQDLLRSRRLDASAFREVAFAAATASDPPDPVGFRRALIEECVEQALTLALGRVTL
jgi:CO/xanthine dehydrogenase FAD-binding subunit